MELKLGGEVEGIQFLHYLEDNNCVRLVSEGQAIL